MVISSDEAIKKAGEFAENSWFSLLGDVREESRLIPSSWRIHFVGDYQDFEIDVDAETGEIFRWRCQSPLQIAISKVVQRFQRAEEQGSPLRAVDIVKIVSQEHEKAYTSTQGN